MALFLKGKYTGLYQAGSSQCVRDTWRFYPNGHTVNVMVTRRDAESMLGRFWRYQDISMKLNPINEEQPSLGGRVKASVKTFDFRTFTPSIKTYYGAYGEDFIALGEFAIKGEPSEEELLQIFEDSSSNVLDKHLFKYADSRLLYSRTVNAEKVDAEIEHAIVESELRPLIHDTWTERLFYGVGNKSM